MTVSLTSVLIVSQILSQGQYQRGFLLISVGSGWALTDRGKETDATAWLLSLRIQGALDRAKSSWL